MSYRVDRANQWGIWLRTIENMQIQSQEILADLAVCGLLFSMAMWGEAEPTFAVAAITVVQSVHLPRMFKAYREAKYNLPEEYES